MKNKLFSHLKNDIPASVVVFFVALPLCLAIAHASGAPLFSGLIAGMIGGIIVGAISDSKIGVSGPAAGLAAIVAGAIQSLGYESFLVAVVIGGVLQIILGILRAGIIGYYFPSSVIKGMLSGIGIFIILKEIPHFLGYDIKDFFAVNHENFAVEIIDAFKNIQIGSALIGVLALITLILWDNVLAKTSHFFKVVQGALIVVVGGIVFHLLTKGSAIEITANHLVNVPEPDSLKSFIGQFSFPNFNAIGNSKVWITGITIAVVASLETLLCVEATDKLDPHKNVTPTNRELLAQGTGNIISGLIGGLPITQVIVRSSANIQSGGRTKLSAIIHGFLIVISIILVPNLLNMIPLSVLAAILLVVGYKLAKPSTFKLMWNNGWKQFIPFIVTILGIIFINLLWGIGLGLAVGIVVILIKSFENSHFLHKEEAGADGIIKMTLAEEVTFFNKGSILNELNDLPENSYLELDVRKTRYLDHDIIEILEDFAFKAKERNIDIKLISERGIIENPPSYIEFFKRRPIV